MTAKTVLSRLIVSGAVLALAAAPAFPWCDSFYETYAIFQCADLGYFAPLPPGYVPSDIHGVFWQVGFGNSTLSLGGEAGDGTGIGSLGRFAGNDSGVFAVSLVDGAALDPRFPAGSICLASNNWANNGVDGCVDNPRVESFYGGGYLYDGDDNLLNPYFSAYRVQAGQYGYYTLAAQADYPTAVLLTTDDGAYFSVAAVASVNRGNDGSGENGPCAGVPGSNPAPCDRRPGFYDFTDVRDGLANAAVAGRSDVIPWQSVPAPFASSVTSPDPNDPSGDLQADLTWSGAHVYNDLSVRPSANPTLAPADPNASAGVGVADLMARYGGLVRYVVEVAPRSDPSFASPLLSIACPGDPSCTSATSASLSFPEDSCVRIRTRFGIAPRASTATRGECRLGRCGDIGYEVVSGRICFQASCTPGPEICDGLDNDCDGETDEDFAVGDACTGEGLCGAGSLECASLTTTRCSTDPGGSADGSEPELCDGYDNDCDGATDEGFALGATCDGEGQCGAGVVECAYATTSRCSTEPGGSSDQSVPETCDGYDNDCDGATDEDFAVGSVCDGAGECGAGVVECAGATTSRCSTEPGGSSDQSVPESCDGLDNDCDGTIDSFVTYCGVAACGSTGYCSDGVDSCVPGTPAADDSVCNGIDDDCDGATDEDFAPSPTTCGVGECVAAGETTCVAGATGDTCVPGPPAAEICDNLDNDCDGTTDTFATTCGVGQCASSGSCVAGIDSCVTGAPAAEVCDNLDNDCDGSTDEDLGLGGPCDGVGACGIGTLQCSTTTGTQCSTDPGGFEDQSTTELCDGLDNDCDGAIDEGFGLGMACTGPGECGTGVLECSGPVTVRCSSAPGGSQDQSSPELCDGLDNDCDGRTDETFGIGGPCFGTGACGTGHLECAGPSASICSSDPGGSQDRSSTETCNGQDDDCDGITDEDASGLDADGDGVAGVCDDCPGAYNPAQEDADHDGVGDVCDLCAAVPDPGQSDADQDGEGDACDLDDGTISLSLPDAGTVLYQQEVGFLSFNVYRADMGTLRSSHLYTQNPASVPEAAKFCGVNGGAFADAFAPLAPGRIVYYLSTGEGPAGEGDLGTDSGGALRPNDNPCP